MIRLIAEFRFDLLLMLVFSLENWLSNFSGFFHRLLHRFIFNCRLLLNPLLFSNRIEFFLLHAFRILYRLIFNYFLDPLPFSDLIEPFQLLICKFGLIRKIILHLLINRLFKRLLFSYWLNPLLFSDLIKPLKLLIDRFFSRLLFSYGLNPLLFSDLIEPFQLLIIRLFFSRLLFSYSLFPLPFFFEL